MELVYLWVEDYKNIHKQGFNFSPRFHCEFKDEYDKDGKLKDDCKLVICDKKKKECEDNDYIENFFGDNINVTAIVGKNGSGKSSVIEILSTILTLGNKIGYFYIISDGIENKCYCNNIEISTSLSCASHIPIDESNRKLSLGRNNSDVKLINYVDMYYLNISHLERDGIIKNDAISMDDPIQYLGIYKKNDFEVTNEKSIDQSFSKFDLSKFNFLQTYTITHLLRDKKYQKQLFDIFKIKQPKYIKLNPDIETLENKKKSNSVKKEGYAVDDRMPALIDKIFLFIKSLDEDKKIEIDSDKFEELFEFQNFGNEIKLEFLSEDDKTIRFSAGEKTILYYLERINYMLLELKKSNKPTVLLWDEIELYLHPMWQKRILNIIIDFMQTEKLDNLLHIIVATHSPFILSDIPKQNIIFLDKDEKGNCKVVDGLKEKKQTFGANIHTLLSDSFFMEDGLMGEFAKGKIDEVIQYLNGNKNTEIKNNDEAQKLVNIIGEPIVKNQLQRMLDSKRLKKIDEIDSIKKNMETMQKRLDELEK